MNSLFSIFDMQKNFYSSSEEMSYKNLKKKLMDFLEIFRKHSQDLYKALKESYDVNLWDYYHGEFKLVEKEINYFIKNLKKFRTAKDYPNNFANKFFNRSKSYHHPYGSCLFLLNQAAPISKTILLLIGALACGNSLFVKLPHYTSEISKLIKCIFKEIFNDNFIYFINDHISENDLKAIYDFNFDLVFYSGNLSNAKTIMRIFSFRLTKVVLDINNKNPVILDETADLEKAAKQIVWSKMMFAGLTSFSPSFLVIHESIIQVFLKHLKVEYDIQFGKGDKWNNIAKIDTQKNYDNIVAIYNKSLAKSRVIFGGSFESKQRKMELTLVQVDDLKSALLSQDINSPILPVVIFNSFSDIAGIVKHNDYPSCIYFFSKNKKRIQNLSSNLESRYFYINSINMPFLKGFPLGGIKSSGSNLYSREESINVFSYKKVEYKQKWDKKTKYKSFVEKTQKVKNKFKTTH